MKNKGSITRADNARGRSGASHCGVHASFTTDFAAIIFVCVTIIAMGVLGLIPGCKSGEKLSSGVPHDSVIAESAAFPGGSGDGSERLPGALPGPGGDESTLEPLDGDGSGDKRGDAYGLVISDGKGKGGGDDSIALTITTKKQDDWKYVLGYVHYNAEHWNPVEFEKGSMFDETDDDDLGIGTLNSEKGKYAFWIGLLNFDKKDPKHGGDVATILFEKEEWDPPKGPSPAPDDNADKVFDLHEYQNDLELYPKETSSENQDRLVVWGEHNIGDGNLQASVDIAGLTALSRWNYTVVSDHPPFINETLDPVDFDNNGEINFSVDQPYIAFNLYENVDGYQIRLYRQQYDIEYVYNAFVAEPADRSLYNNYVSAPVAQDPMTALPKGNFWNWNGAIGYCLSLDRRLNGYFGGRVAAGDYWVGVTPRDLSDMTWGLESQRVLMHFDSDNLLPTASFYATPFEGDPPLEVEFNAHLSHDDPLDEQYGGHIMGWRWDFDGPDENGILDYVEHGYITHYTYEDGGTYEAYLQVYDDEGGTDEIHHTITVGFPPDAVLTATPDRGNAPLEVLLDASGSTDPDGTIVDYEWDLDGDLVFNEYDNGENDARGNVMAAFTYDNPGDYTPSVRVTDNDGGKSTAQASVHVNFSPVASLTIDPDYGRTPLEVTFDASASDDPDGTIVSCEWDWDDDGTYDYDSGATKIVSHTYAAQGQYVVGLRITDDDGLTDELHGLGPIAIWDHLNEIGFRYRDSQGPYVGIIDAQTGKATFLVELDCFDNDKLMWTNDINIKFITDPDNPEEIERINWDSMGVWSEVPEGSGNWQWVPRWDRVQAMDGVDIKLTGVGEDGILSYILENNSMLIPYALSMPFNPGNPPANCKVRLSTHYVGTEGNYLNVPVGQAYLPGDDKGLMLFRFTTDVVHGWIFEIEVVCGEGESRYVKESGLPDDQSFWRPARLETSGFHQSATCYIP